MNGLRILGFIALVVIGLCWAVFRTPASVEDDRGWVETDAAFDALAQALADFEPLLAEVTARGFMIDLKTNVQSMRERLAELREERLQLRDDDQLARGKRLPAYRELAKDSDVLLAGLSALANTVRARYDFFLRSEPLLELARAQRDALNRLPGLGSEALSRRQALNAALASYESRAGDAQVLLGKNPRQNVEYAKAVLDDLARLIDAQRDALGL